MKRNFISAKCVIIKDSAWKNNFERKAITKRFTTLCTCTALICSPVVCADKKISPNHTKAKYGTKDNNAERIVKI